MQVILRLKTFPSMSDKERLDKSKGWESRLSPNYMYFLNKKENAWVFYIIDTTPPTIGCPGNIYVTANQLETTSVVSWTEPTAYDSKDGNVGYLYLYDNALKLT